ncbi:MAG TPA: FKBP-type peptidyl-prolyl cis-trans isomerase [Paludibacteraceae bacterium]|jgi:FKBP-type peptidyl-prolyl cis-trans isomerase FklB|nr:FKBP-type peptidyl-prolyl cis-trans isomerase [Paludibacteraceae bacterium]HPD27527.1 FKBP-type peptidyl-prolyl cis-trans isomerase [Paludibacteraceae bacterium]HPW96219.1 FKBP-type peptidyl-prolyl cis-trans isomerase [Paludibacteraceae bacterium]HQC04470.1 FKBP-type peptidyl-prolyl cis-trans isomerase [Paludibacteraceae bacterium]HQP79954.1 FKBP-type peptidyl-prolyl cis-trans isomerase [Paludibacteraceae bacterium]
MDKLSYALGLSFGQSLRQNRIQGIDYESFAKGVEAMCEGKMPEISVQEAQKLLDAYFSEIESKQQAAGKEQKSAGEKFLAENAKKAGVITTASGLQYEILKEGRGQKPTATDKVKVHYHGTLLDGTVFDSSVKRNTPASFGVNQVIKGWVEALQLMPVGSKWKLYIPQELAYGAHGAGETIRPYSALIFEVELLEIL